MTPQVFEACMAYSLALILLGTITLVKAMVTHGR